MTRRRLPLLATLVFGVAAEAAAQAPRPPARPQPAVRQELGGASGAARLFIGIDGRYQVTSTEFADTLRREIYAEEARFDTAYGIDPGPAFDVSGTLRVWRWLGAGVALGRFARRTPVEISAAIPHPFFFNRSRTFTGRTTDPRREELALHVQARGLFDVARRFQVAVFGGPSYVHVRQGVITAVSHAESYPYDEASFASATTTRSSDGSIGFHLGGDMAFFFARHLGVGAMVQYSRATVELPETGEKRQVDAGGLQAGAGVRLRF